MNQEQIRAKYHAYKEKLVEVVEERDEAMAPFEGRIAAIRSLMEKLKLQCDHPNLREYSCQGDIGHRCPDCGHDA